jgi:predicted DNA-binding transcriptional regulator YafY
MDNLSPLTNETHNDSHRENKKVRLRQQLIDLSIYYLLDMGYEKLAEEANVSVRTILRYFDSKAGLVSAPCKNNLQLFKCDIQNTNRSVPAFESWQHHVVQRMLQPLGKCSTRYVSQMASI